MASRKQAVPPTGYPYRSYNQPAPPVRNSQPSYGRQSYAAPPPPARYPHSGYNQPAPPVRNSQPSYGGQNYAAPPPPARYPYSGYNQPAPPVQYSQPSYGQQNHSYAAPPPPRDPYSAGAPPGDPYSAAAATAGYPYSEYNQPAPPVQYSQPSYGQPSYGQQNYGQPVGEQENSNFGGMGTGLAVGAVVGAVGGITLVEGAEYMEDNIAKDAAQRVEENHGDDGDYGGYAADDY